MAIIKKISQYADSTWHDYDIGADASNINISINGIDKTIDDIITSSTLITNLDRTATGSLIDGNIGISGILPTKNGGLGFNISSTANIKTNLASRNSSYEPTINNQGVMTGSTYYTGVSGILPVTYGGTGVTGVTRIDVTSYFKTGEGTYAAKIDGTSASRIWLTQWGKVCILECYLMPKSSYSLAKGAGAIGNSKILKFKNRNFPAFPKSAITGYAAGNSQNSFFTGALDPEPSKPTGGAADTISNYGIRLTYRNTYSNFDAKSNTASTYALRFIYLAE